MLKPKEYGGYLRKLRDERRMTLVDVEKRSGISTGYLSQIEAGARGIPSIATLVKLASAYSIPLSILAENAHRAAKEEENRDDDLDFFRSALVVMSPEERRLAKDLIYFILGRRKDGGKGWVSVRKAKE